MIQNNTEIQKVEVSNSPAEMIRMAVSGGADLEKLGKLLDLQERWEANEARKAYHVSMSDFKMNPPKIDKDKAVNYKTDKGNVKYNHATLANVVEKITKELSKHGLSASWRTHQNGTINVTCRITHILGHSEETTLSASADNSGSKNSIQAIGSTITYLQRYTLLAALGLATYDQDDDGAGVNQEKISEKELHDLRDQFIALSIIEQKFVDYLGIQKLEDMPKTDLPKAQALLDARKKNNKEKK